MGRLGWAWGFAGAVLVSPLQAQGGRTVLAVLPFENAGSYGEDEEVSEGLRLGIPAMLSSALADRAGVRVAEPSRVAQALEARHLRSGGRLDAATAGQVGKATGARYSVTGSFADFYGKFRINARVVDTETGGIVKVVSNDEASLQDRARLGLIIQAVSEKIAAAVGLPPLPSDAASSRAGALPTEALTQYSRGLLYESRGDKDKAADAYQHALSAYPEYPEARDALRRMGPISR
ncbi:MAG TPA: CsgG/HfaB family protein [Gemmatimonadales bacterium]|nr:CsgG/HfaB family protein [Gemmatimonadales bacterium]